MGNQIKQVDAYIAKSADFAKPILQHLRELVHKACPDVQETIKWGMPYYVYEGNLCYTASFKQHCAFGFAKASLMPDPQGLLANTEKTAMGQLGRITALSDLPPDKILLAYIKAAVKLNQERVALPVKTTAAEKKQLAIPDYFQKALNKNKKAKQVFEDFSYTNKKEYIEWLTDAKTEDTRNKRLADALEWIAEGKMRNWKYMKK